MTTNTEPVIDWDTIVLAKGSHPSTQTDCGKTPEVCLWEALNYERSQVITDTCPVDVSRVLHAFSMQLNDLLPDDRRQQLKHYRHRLANTADQPAADERVGYLCLDWLIRTYTPAWLRLAGLTDHADTLAGCGEIVDMVTAGAVADHVRAARSAAARAAAEVATRDATEDAAENVAGVAARVAAWDATKAAARARLAPTVTELQDSVFRLLDRMLAQYETGVTA